MRQVVASEPLSELDYAEVVDADTLIPCQRIDPAATRRYRALIAAVVGPVRLIDNAAVGPEVTGPCN
jgi:pantothenate synthetase